MRQALLAALVVALLVAGATLARQRRLSQDRAALAAGLERAVAAGTLARAQAWRPRQEAQRDAWLGDLGQVLLQLEPEPVRARGGEVRGAGSPASASDAQVLDQVRALLPRQPGPRFTLGPKDEAAGWLTWAPAVRQLPGLGKALRREAARLRAQGTGAPADPAPALVVEFLPLLQAFGGADYTQALAAQLAQREALLALLDGLPHGAPPGAPLAPEATLQELDHLLAAGQGQDPLRGTLQRIYDAGLAADRSQLAHPQDSERAADLLEGLELLALLCGEPAQAFAALEGEVFMGRPARQQELAAVFATGQDLRQRYALTRAALALAQAARGQAAWPAKAPAGLPLDPSTGEPLAYTAGPGGARLEAMPQPVVVGGGWDLAPVTWPADSP